MNTLKSTGYFTKLNFLNPALCDQLNTECEKLLHNEVCEGYYDSDGNLRRIENFTFKSQSLTNLNNDIINFLKFKLGNDYVLFKDKVNFKPAGGEGFFAHYDGIFEFTSLEGVKRNGWHQYANDFITVLVALDDFTEENGALEIADCHDESFEKLLARTKKNGTPDLLPEVEAECTFQHVLIKKGDLCVFDHRCPHRSEPNRSNHARGSLYLTYSPLSSGNFYEQYFNDKKNSKNKDKSLSGKTV